jgi:mannitol/fructose-specific phosphotransferase system IIA component (Ntr-type)
VIPLAGYLDRSRVADLRATTKEEALAEVCALAAASREVGDPAALARAVREREEALSTGIGLGIAVPHAKIPSVKGFVLALGRSRRGIDFQALDGRPVHVVVLIAGPEGRQAEYLRVLAGVTLRLKREEVRRALMEAEGADEMLGVLA